MSNWREDCLHYLTDSVKTDTEAFTRFAGLVKTAGFEYCSFGVRPSLLSQASGDLWWTTYPQSWQDYYFSHDYLSIDPVIYAALHSALPVIWTEPKFDKQRDFWESARGHGIRHGWTLALHGAQGETAMVSLARSDMPLDENELAEKEARLMWLSHTAYAAIMDAGYSNRSDPLPTPELSSREREILRWTLAGKTSEETGTILGISARTVNFHVSVILHKLNVVNKTQAVAKAILLNLLD
jgi:LuxR family transcriptional regulator